MRFTFRLFALCLLALLNACPAGGGSQSLGQQFQFDANASGPLQIISKDANHNWTLFDGTYPSGWPLGLTIPSNTYVAGSDGNIVAFPNGVIRAECVIKSDYKSFSSQLDKLITAAGYTKREGLDQGLPMPGKQGISHWMIQPYQANGSPDTDGLNVEYGYGPAYAGKVVYTISVLNR